MKTIKVTEFGCSNITYYYRNAKTKALRGVLGYMLQTGRPDNLTLGGAFALLSELSELSKAETYQLTWENEDIAKEIIAVAEAAMAGAFRKFAPTKREVRKYNKNVNRVWED